MIVLGINGGFRQGYQDVSACLMRDGQVVAALEEERISRVKHSAGRLPYLSVIEVLKIASISIQEVDLIAFHGSTWELEIEDRIRAYFISNFGFCPLIERHHHHLCHAAGAYYSSGFDQSLIITMDSSGDGVSMQVAAAKESKIEVLKQFHRPNSLGIFYSMITQYCGFTRDSEEYKLMGLAAYGDKSRFDFSWLLSYDSGELMLKEDFIPTLDPKAPQSHRDEMTFNQAFIDRLGLGRRSPSEPISQFYRDIAASAQNHLENIVVEIARCYLRKTGHKNLCTAGGVALNCLMNQRLMNELEIDNFYIMPASTDAGISMGAAWLSTVNHGGKPQTLSHTYLGNEYKDEEIAKVLTTCQIQYKLIENPSQVAAKLIAAGNVVAWFQGSMEFGPRALGNRSILANPSTPDIQSIVNQKVKFREGFRPFGASILEEDMPGYFEGRLGQSPYMTITYNTRRDKLKMLQGVTHVDGTCRIQTVSVSQNQLFYELLSELKAITGVGVCLNTSFNLNYEPIVCTPQNAIATFYASGLDAMVIGHFLVLKRKDV